MGKDQAPDKARLKDWELVQKDGTGTGCKLHRIRVPGGWLYRYTTSYPNGADTMCYVPDPNFVPTLHPPRAPKVEGPTGG